MLTRICVCLCSQDELRFCQQLDCRAPCRQLSEFSHVPNEVEVCGHRAVMNRDNDISMFWLVRCRNDHARRWVVRDRYVAAELIVSYLQRGDMLEIEDSEVDECVAAGSGDDLFEPSAHRSLLWLPHNENDDCCKVELPDCGYDVQGSSGAINEQQADAVRVQVNIQRHKRKRANMTPHYPAIDPQKPLRCGRQWLAWAALHE